MEKLSTKPAIYILKNTVNSKIYIGKANNLRDRISHHKSAEKSSFAKSYIHRAIKKYGWSSFTVSILEFCENMALRDILLKESEYIKQFNSTNPKIGYNIVEFSNDMTGYKHSEESKRKISLAGIGRKPGFYSNETKEKLKKMYSIPVKQIDKETNKIIKIWLSSREAAKHIGKITDRSNIGSVCRKSRNFNTCLGFKWEYATQQEYDEYINKN